MTAPGVYWLCARVRPDVITYTVEVLPDGAARTGGRWPQVHPASWVESMRSLGRLHQTAADAVQAEQVEQTAQGRP